MKYENETYVPSRADDPAVIYWNSRHPLEIRNAELLSKEEAPDLTHEAHVVEAIDE